MLADADVVRFDAPGVMNAGLSTCSRFLARAMLRSSIHDPVDRWCFYGARTASEGTTKAVSTPAF